MAVRRGDPCTIEDCSKPVAGRGWCAMHYARWRTYGDPLHAVRRYSKQDPTCSVEDCAETSHGLGLCKLHHKRQIVHGETTDPFWRRFRAQIEWNGDSECWIWAGAKQPNGYGVYGSGKNGSRLAHRIAYTHLVGPVPTGLVLDHLCRNRACVNPKHLDPVTPCENIRRGDQGAFWGYKPIVVTPKTIPEKPESCTGCSGPKPLYKRSLCRPCYRKWLKDPNVDRPSKRTPEQRFWAKVKKSDGCWLWTASIHAKTGYGRFGVRHGQMVDAHRYSFQLAEGEIPAGHDVHHTCHVRHCVNPNHLQAVTRAENLRLRKVRRA